MKVKQLLKRVLPVSVFRMEHIAKELQANSERQQKKIIEDISALRDEILNISHKIDSLHETYKELCDSDKIKDEFCSIEDTINKGYSTIIKLQKENLWAAIFNNTISGSEWLVNQTFSPGRWAMGYPALYILYRVLEQFNPHHILELGLGQSTIMITQYAERNADIEHFVVEHDNAWIKFFKKRNTISLKTSIVCLDRESASFKDADNVRVFKNFKDTFESNKFDLVVIDAPLGGDMKKYARIDVLSLIEANLCEEFVVILDDVNRVGERNTMNEISHQLKQANIKYSHKVYEGEKATCIWTTPQWDFLCSL